MKTGIGLLLQVLIIIFHYLNVAWSADTDIVGSNVIGSYSAEVFKVILSLGLVLLIFYIGASVFKKYAGSSIKSNSRIRILGGLSLGAKDRVVIIEAGNVNLLLGVSNGGISKLHQFSDSELNTNEEYMEDESKLLNFSHHLEKIISKKSR